MHASKLLTHGLHFNPLELIYGDGEAACVTIQEVNH